MSTDNKRRFYLHDTEPGDTAVYWYGDEWRVEAPSSTSPLNTEEECEDERLTWPEWSYRMRVKEFVPKPKEFSHRIYFLNNGDGMYYTRLGWTEDRPETPDQFLYTGAEVKHALAMFKQIGFFDVCNFYFFIDSVED